MGNRQWKMKMAMKMKNDQMANVAGALLVLTMICLPGGASVSGQSVRVPGAACEVPPVLRCPDAKCPGDVVTNGGPVVESKTNRNYFLDYPCDLKRGEKVTFILSLHGGGS